MLAESELNRLHDLYVDPAMRAIGIGRLLVQAAIDAACGPGSGSLMLSVSPKNKQAQRLFEATGLRRPQNRL